VRRLDILDQIVICWNPTSLGISRLLLKRIIVWNLLLINMSRPIGDIYLKKVRTLFCVRMLTLKFQSLSRSISANKVSLPAITMVSQDTSSHTIIRSGIRNLGSRNKSQRQVSLALYLPSLIMLLGKSGNTLKRVLPYAITVARMVTSRPNTSERSFTCPRKFKFMRAWLHDEECLNQFGQIGHGL
jgi:hypothetical protein